MSIHYKFKSSLDYDTVTFDGLHISLGELKKQIMQQKKIGKSSDFDLQVTNAQTKEVYTNDDEIISKNASLIVARIPVTAQQKKQWDRDSNTRLGIKNIESVDSKLLTNEVDIAALDVPEEEKIKTMMNQSTSDYDPSHYLKVKGGNQVGPVPQSYTCYKCQQRGHWIKDCPIPATTREGISWEAIRKTSGIPTSFMVPVDGPLVPGARLTPHGDFVVPAIDHEVYKEKKIEKPPFLAEKEKPVETTPIPEDLMCNLCKDILQDAVMVPCCGNSFCDECIRNLLVEMEEVECPECSDKDVTPDTLIPNRFLRNNVLKFKNKTGYIKKIQPGEKTKSPPRPTLPDFVLPDSEPKPELLKEEVKPVTISAQDTNMLFELALDAADKPAETKDEQTSDAVTDRSHETDRRFRNGSYREHDKENFSQQRRNKSYHKSPPQESEEGGVYSIPSIVAGHPMIMDPSYPPPRNVFPMGGERSGTPTVDERYDPYVRPPGGLLTLPQQPFPTFDPNYPPPMGGPHSHMGMPFRGGYDGPPYRGRYPPRHHHQSHGSRGTMPPQSLEGDDKYRAWMAWLQEKEEQEKHGKGRESGNARRSGSRSRSGSPKRRRSFSPKRSSRSRTRSPRRSLSRKRSRSRSVRSQRSFVMSKSRSRSISKSPILRKLSPRKSPIRGDSYHRGDRYRESYRDGGYGGWNGDYRDRRGGYQHQHRGRPQSHYSPNRSYSSYYRGRRRSRSGSNSRGRFDEGKHRRSGSRDRARYERPRTRERERERRSPERERSGRRRSREPSYDRDQRLDRSESRQKRRSVSKPRSVSPQHDKEHRRSRSVARNWEKSVSPEVSPARSSHHGRSERNPSPVPILETHERKIILTEEASPVPSEKSKMGGKKEKKKDKDKKKRKKEKETAEEKEARKKRKREKKEEKKRKEQEKSHTAGTKTDEEEPKKQNINDNVAEKTDFEENLLPKAEPSAGFVHSFSEVLPVRSSPGNRTPESVDANSKILSLSPGEPPLSEPEPDPDAMPEEGELDDEDDVMFAPLPELSKWELEESGLPAPTKHRLLSPDTPRVTSEVLKRAENAIFKKAITALRNPTKPEKGEQHKVKPEPIEEKKSEPSEKETSSKSSERPYRSKPEVSRKNESRKVGNSIQITVPVSVEDRAVGYAPMAAADRSDKSGLNERSPPSRISIKDRLGSKVEGGAPRARNPSPQQPILRLTEKSRHLIHSGAETVDLKRKISEESEFLPNYDDYSDEDERPTKRKSTESKRRTGVSEVKKRSHTSSDSSDESVKKKKRKTKKEKKLKKKKKEMSDSSSSDSETERKKHKKSKKKKKTRH